MCAVLKTPGFKHPLSYESRGLCSALLLLDDVGWKSSVTSRSGGALSFPGDFEVPFFLGKSVSRDLKGSWGHWGHHAWSV